jgi:radical SAM protein with 4Fe4S-binding SPASM domain
MSGTAAQARAGTAKGFALIVQKWAGMAKFRRRPRLAAALYRLALLIAPDLPLAQRERAKSRPRQPGQAPHIRALILGTSGTCNASCAHCPTGKASTAATPRGTMPMALFRKIVDGIAADGVAVDHVGFGLFGDGLLDPLVIERARYLRDRLPDLSLAVNTNGAAYAPARHAALFPLIGSLVLHCESLVPATYDRLMMPLRARNVFPKYAMILRDFPGKVRVSVPVSRANLAELDAIRAWFMARGAREVVFDALSSRCMDDRTTFDQLALAPVPIRCSAAVTEDLIVDCDGAVVACCNDFAREQPIGNLASDGFRETMAHRARRRFAEDMAEGRHDAIPLCSRCFGDIRTPGFPFDRHSAAA